MSIFSWLFGPRVAKSDSINLTSEHAAQLLDGATVTISGKTVTEKNLLNVSAVWSAIRIVAETIGTLPIHVYERTPEGRRRANEHPLYELLHLQPNPHMTSIEWREAIAVSLCVWGQAYNRVDRLGDKVTGITPVNKPNVRVTQRNGAVRYFLKEDGTETELERADIMPIKGFGSSSDLEGFPPFRFHANAIGLAQVAEEFAAQFFNDGARPSGLLLGESMPTEDQSTQINKLVDKARRKLLIMGGNFKYTPISSTNEEAQLLQTRRMQIGEIARIWRVPLHLMMESDDVKHNNLEQQNKNFLDYTLLPYVKRIEQAMNTVLLTQSQRSTHYIEFDLKGLLRGDSKSRGEFYRNMRMIGAMTPNEVREAENFPKMEGGDDLHVPMNMAPMDQLREILSDSDTETDSDDEDEHDE